MSDPRKRVEMSRGVSRLGGRSPLPAALRRTVGRFAREIRQDHGLLDRPTAERLGRLLKAALTPRNKPGRKPTPEVLRAVELRRADTPWPKVYSEVISGYWALPYDRRFYLAHKLRDAVSAHFRRQKRRTKRHPEKQR